MIDNLSTKQGQQSISLLALYLMTVFLALLPSSLSHSTLVTFIAIPQILLDARANRLKLNEQKAGTFKTLDLEVQFQHKTSIPANSVINVTLESIAKMELKPEIIAETTVAIKREPPYQLQLSYNEKRIYKTGIYTLRARIKKQGELLFINSKTQQLCKKLNGLGHCTLEQKNIKILLNKVEQKTNLINTYWKLAVLFGTKTNLGAEQMAPYIKFNDSKKVGGYLGCNYFGAEFNQQQYKLRFSAVTLTSRLCFVGMIQEIVFSMALQRAVKFKLQSDNLLLLDREDKQIALFEARYVR